MITGGFCCDIVISYGVALEFLTALIFLIAINSLTRALMLASKKYRIIHMAGLSIKSLKKRWSY